MLLHQKSERRRRAAFTLMEMLIVVAIIVALAGIGGYYLFGALGSSQKDIAKTKISTLNGACLQYMAKHNDWPEGLKQLTEKDSLGVKYLEKEAILDPWGKEFQYDKTGTKNNNEKPDIWTTSPAPENETIGNWYVEKRK